MTGSTHESPRRLGRDGASTGGGPHTGAKSYDVVAFLKQEEGLEVVEWLLVLGGVIVPLAALIYKVMNMVAQFYSFNSWIISLPFL